MRTNAFLVLDKTDSVSINSVKDNLERSLKQEGVRILSSASQADFRLAVDQHMLMIYVILVVISGIIMAVGGLGLATTIRLNVMERRRGKGVVRAIGARAPTVWLIIVTEGGGVGGLGWGLASLAARPVSKFVGGTL